MSFVKPVSYPFESVRASLDSDVLQTRLPKEFGNLLSVHRSRWRLERLDIPLGTGSDVVNLRDFEANFARLIVRDFSRSIVGRHEQIGRRETDRTIQIRRKINGVFLVSGGGKVGEDFVGFAGREEALGGRVPGQEHGGEWPRRRLLR